MHPRPAGCWNHLLLPQAGAQPHRTARHHPNPTPMKSKACSLLAALLATAALHGQAVDWRIGPVDHTGGGTGTVLINTANDLEDWLTANPAGNGTLLADSNASGTYYFGFDWTVTDNAGETGTGGYFGGLWFYYGTTERSGAGNAWNPLVYGIAGGITADVVPATPYVVGVPVRMVLKVQFNAAANDNLTLWINPLAGVGETSQTGVPQVAATSNMAADTITLRAGNGTGASRIQNLMVSTDFESAAAWDADADGLADGWERRYGLDPADDGSTNPDNGPDGDPDVDGLSNLEEFQRGSRPDAPTDSDGDGLLDSAEMNGSQNPFTNGVPGTPPGDPTDPYDPDSDNDGIQDGEEVAPGADSYVTDPNDADTDNDSYKDGVETLYGGDPTNPASIPVIPNGTIIGIEHFDYFDGSPTGLTGGEFFDFDNSLEGNPAFGHTGTTSDWTVLAGAPLVRCGRIVSANGASLKREFNGPVEGDTLGNDEREGRFEGGSSDVLYYRYLLRRDQNVSYSGVSLFDFGGERCFVGVPNSPNPASGALEFGIQQSNATLVIGSNMIWTGIAPLDHRDYLVVAKADFATGTVSIWVDPDLGQPEGPPDGLATMANLPAFNATGIRLASGNPGAAYFDELVVATTWQALSTPATDTDADGLRDSWETLYGYAVGTDDSAANSDADSLTAIEEQAAGTDPLFADTDADGLDDGQEVNGTLNPYTASVLGAPPGDPTNPCKNDTDDDGIFDDEEIVAGYDGFVTDPTRADTDGDGGGDGAELLYATDPTDPASLFGGDRALIGADDFSGYADGPVADLAGGTGFDFDNTLVNDAFIGHTGSNSDYDVVFGAPTVSGGALITNNSGAKREFNGPGEGVVVNGDEWSGRFNQDPGGSDAQVVYFRADMTRSAGASWSGISAYDFGSERTFVGVVGAPNPASGNFEFSIGAPAPTSVYTGIAPVPGKTYTLVCKIDYRNDLMSLWVNPDLTGLEPPPLASTPFTIGNWTTGVRLASGGTGAVQWDNLVVARQWSALGIYPGVPADDYLAWIAGFPGVGGQAGFADDPDGDGIANGAESFLGTDPSAPTPGLTGASATPASLTFTHSESNAIPTDVSAAYEWSADLVSWFASGADNGAGVTVTIAENSRIDNNAPDNDVVTATATVTAGTTPRLFVRLRADLSGAP